MKGLNYVLSMCCHIEAKLLYRYPHNGALTTMHCNILGHKGTKWGSTLHMYLLTCINVFHDYRAFTRVSECSVLSDTQCALGYGIIEG